MTSSASGRVADGLAQQVDPRERVRLAREQEHRALDRRKVRDAGAELGSARPMQRVAEEHEAGDRPVRLGRPIGGEETRDAAAVGVAADRDAGRVGQLRGVGRDRLLGLALGQVDRDRPDPAIREACDVRLHRRARPGRTVPEHEDEIVDERAVRCGSCGWLSSGARCGCDSRGVTGRRRCCASKPARRPGDRTDDRTGMPDVRVAGAAGAGGGGAPLPGLRASPSR